MAVALVVVAAVLAAVVDVCDDSLVFPPPPVAPLRLRYPREEVVGGVVERRSVKATGSCGWVRERTLDGWEASSFHFFGGCCGCRHFDSSLLFVARASCCSYCSRLYFFERPLGHRWRYLRETPPLPPWPHRDHNYHNYHDHDHDSSQQWSESWYEGESNFVGSFVSSSSSSKEGYKCLLPLNKDQTSLLESRLFVDRGISLSLFLSLGCGRRLPSLLLTEICHPVETIGDP